jgi:hypothetical protein
MGLSVLIPSELKVQFTEPSGTGIVHYAPLVQLAAWARVHIKNIVAEVVVFRPAPNPGAECPAKNHSNAQQAPNFSH